MDDLQRLLSAAPDDDSGADRDAGGTPPEPAPEARDDAGDGGIGRMLGGGSASSETTDGESAKSPRRPSRSAAMTSGSLLLGAAVLGGMYWRAGPSTAAAAVDPAAERSVGAFLKEGVASALASATDHVEAVVERFRTYPDAAQVPPGDLRTNPFADAAPPAGVESTGSARMTPDRTSGGPPRGGDERSPALSAAAGLSLQSVVHGSSRRACLIDGKLYREGDAFDAVVPATAAASKSGGRADPTAVEFVVESIGPDGVVLRRGESRYALSIGR